MRLEIKGRTANFKFNNINTYIIFILSLSLYLFLGFVGTFYNDVIYSRYDIFYDTDPLYKFLFFSDIYYKLGKHPFIFILTPFLKSILYITKNKVLAVILFQSFIASLNNIILFLILKKIGIRLLTTTFFTIIYALSFSSLLFTSVTEVYLYSSCTVLLLVYFTCTNSDANKANMLLIAFLYVVSFGINLFNIFLYIPILIYLFSRQTNRKIKILEFLIFFIIFISVFFVIGDLISIGLLSNVLFPQNSLLNHGGLAWVVFDFSYSRLIYVLQETFVSSIYALETGFNMINKQWYFEHEQNISIFFPFFMLLFFAFYGKKTFFVPKYILTFCSVIIIHFIINFFYNNSWFLYSQNYLLFFIIVLAYLYSSTNIRIQNIVLSLFLIFQILMNFGTLFYLAKWINREHFLDVVIKSLKNVCTIDTIVVLLIILFIVIKKIYVNKTKRGL